MKNGGIKVVVIASKGIYLSLIQKVRVIADLGYNTSFSDCYYYTLSKMEE